VSDRTTAPHEQFVPLPKLQAAEVRIAQLEAQLAKALEEVNRYRNGFQGSCYACEPVAVKNQRLEAQLAEVRQLVDSQSDDPGLWFMAGTAPEAYLQQELRRLHAVVEGEPYSETREEQALAGQKGENHD